MLSEALFQPGINRFLSKLDDSTSMFSVAVRDGVDSSGRTLMEMKRSEHGGRERLIEEALTMLIWGFGINFLKNRVYDPLARKLSAVKHPDLDMDLLTDTPQKLTPEILTRFKKKFPDVYDSLDAVIQNPKLRQSYHQSNMAKFLVATGLPVLLIAFGIPTLNQWLTRKKLARERPAVTGWKPPLHTSFRHPDQFSRFENNPSGNNSPKLAPAGQPPRGPKGFSRFVRQDPRFGGLGTSAAMGASALLQNERYNTLLVDGVISGGRLSKSRNRDEMLEILFREGTIIFFLYFAQGFIQKHIGRLMNQLLKTDTGLDFKAVKALHERYGNEPGRFVADVQRSVAAFKAGLPQPKKGLGLSPAASEKAVAELVRDAFLRGDADNLLFETAKNSGWIKTVPRPDGHPLLDLTQKIQTGPILELADTLEGMAAKMVSSGDVVPGKTLDRMLRKSMMGRFSAMMLANAVCAFFLSYLCPKIQHWMTYRRTGRDYFPGAE